MKQENYISPKDYNKLTKHMFIDDYGDNELLKLIKKCNSKEICEVGCGTGHITKKLAESCKGKTIIASDMDKKK